MIVPQLSATILCATTLGAAAQPPSPQTPDPQQPERLINRVELTVDNKAVLRSTIVQEFRSIIRQNLEGGTTPTPAEMRSLFLDLLQRAESDAVRSQAALNSSGRTPEEIETIVERERNRRQANELKEIGSHASQLAVQKQGILGRSQFQRNQMMRDSILREVARSEVLARYRDRRALLITPKQLYARFLTLKARLPTEPSFRLETLVFRPAPDQDQEALHKRVGEAAAAWRKGGPAAEIAGRFGGIALPSRQRMTRSMCAELLPALQTYPQAAKGDGVSKPIPDPGGNGFYLQRVLSWQKAQELRYEDPRVQAALRRELIRKDLEFELAKAERRSKKLVHIWHNREAAPAVEVPLRPKTPAPAKK